MQFRESLNLTEIHDEHPLNKMTSLEDVIPEENQSSKESIDGYLAVDSVYRGKREELREDTETLLIC